MKNYIIYCFFWEDQETNRTYGEKIPFYGTKEEAEEVAWILFNEGSYDDIVIYEA